MRKHWHRRRLALLDEIGIQQPGGLGENLCMRQYQSINQSKINLISSPVVSILHVQAGDYVWATMMRIVRMQHA